MSKTVITSAGNQLNSEFDKRFGRASWYCLYDEQQEKATFHKNENLNASHGAGTKAAEKMVELGAEKVISGDFGPKAKDLLNKFNIQMVIIQDTDKSVGDIIQKLNQ